MKLNKMTKEELESYSYIDLAKKIIMESRKKLNTLEIFKKICKLLELSSEECENKIGDFYTDLTTDKTFILLENGTWDLSSHHSRNINIDEEDDEELTETEEELEEELDDMAPEEYHEMDDDSNVEDTDLDDIDEIEDDELTIVDEDELE
ncbi:MAG: DNA-directed RNA polymerase subunit delta [Bacilli bacterium]|nr:DNA-directed RNA polymerase subunit delta [Bacilli bacterium]